MPDSSTITKVVVGTVVAAASAAAVYYLFRQEEKVAVSSDDSANKVATAARPVVKLDAKKVTVDQLLVIMDKIVDSQNVMKGIMKTITDEITANNLSFGQTYDLVETRQPNDPMEETGLSMNEFDELLDRHQEDPRILDSIAKIIGPSEEDLAGDDGKILSVQELIDIHQFMLDQLKEITVEVQKSKGHSDARTLTVTAQVLVGARVEGRFKVTSPAVERSVMVHQNQLATNHQIATINMMMQQAMTELMGDNIGSRE